MNVEVRTADRAFTVGVPASATEPDLAGTLESIRHSADAAGGAYEIIVAVNGGDEPAALAGVRAFAATAGVPLVEPDGTCLPAGRGAASPSLASVAEPAVAPIDAAAPALAAGAVVRVLRVREHSKVAAWNGIRAAARAPIVVFTDADVRLAPAAIGLLLARLAASPALVAAAGREVAALRPQDGLVARLAALPYRFDFGNLPGRLYALRAAALDEPMPPHVLAEDAYLSVRLGRARFAKVQSALVYLRPPATWREYVDQRIRNELGKRQLAADFPHLLGAHGFGVTPWRAFVRDLRPREYVLVALSLAVRVYARAAARRHHQRHGFGRSWATLPSTKAWHVGGERTAETGAGVGAPSPGAPGAEAASSAHGT